MTVTTHVIPQRSVPKMVHAQATDSGVKTSNSGIIASEYSTSASPSIIYLDVSRRECGAFSRSEFDIFLLISAYLPEANGDQRHIKVFPVFVFTRNDDIKVTPVGWNVEFGNSLGQVRHLLVQAILVLRKNVVRQLSLATRDAVRCQSPWFQTTPRAPSESNPR